MTMEQRLLLVLESIRDELRGIREAIEPGEQEENEEDSLLQRAKNGVG